MKKKKKISNETVKKGLEANTQSPEVQAQPNLAPKPSEASGLASAKGRKAVERTNLPAIAKRLAEMPESARASYLRAVQGKAPPRRAIKAHCLECCGWQRDEVRLCTGYACALYLYRPYQGDA